MKPAPASRHRRLGGHRPQANFRSKGFYRVVYSTALLERLGPAIRAKTLSAADRVGIVSDGASRRATRTGRPGCRPRRLNHAVLPRFGNALEVGSAGPAFALSYAGLQPTTATLSLLLNFADEDDFVVWDELASSLGNLRSVRKPTPSRAAPPPAQPFEHAVQPSRARPTQVRLVRTARGGRRRPQGPRPQPLRAAGEATRLGLWCPAKPRRSPVAQRTCVAQRRKDADGRRL